MEVYIIRIYRREKGNPGNIVGTAEKPGEPHGKTFANAEELLKILSQGKQARRKRVSEGIDKV